MINKIAVVGSGVIGTMLAGFLASSGKDVTIVSLFRPETAEFINANGVTVQFGDTILKTPVKSVFAGNLNESTERFDLALISCRSNDTERAVRVISNYMNDGGIYSSLQNGLNDDLMISIVGADTVVPCVCFAGGRMLGPGNVATHDGRFIIGEIDGRSTDRIHQLREILSCAKPTTISDDVLLDRWGKMAEVTLTVPVATISGYPLFANLEDETMQLVYGRLARENFDVAAACGYNLRPIMGLDRAEWTALAAGPDKAVSGKLLDNAVRPPKIEEGQADPMLDGPPKDAYSSDIEKGLPLEIDYTNGYIVNQGRRSGVPTPAHSLIVKMIHEISEGNRKRSPQNLLELVSSVPV